MKLYAWNPAADKNIIEDKSYVCISEELVDFAFSSPSLPPNEEKFCYDVVAGYYDYLFDFSKDVIDIGACHGVYAIELAQKFNHSYAFEPNKTYSYIIGVNAVLNNVVDKVDVYNVFLSDKKSDVDFNGWMSNLDNYVDSQALSSCCYEVKYNDNSVFNKIETTTLDSYNFNNVGFIKIDTEGSELRILTGAVETIKRNNYPPILFEMWPEDSNFITDKEDYKIYCDRLISFLTNLGYDITYNVNTDPGTHLAIHKN